MKSANVEGFIKIGKSRYIHILYQHIIKYKKKKSTKKRLVSLFNNISTFVAYLILKPFLYKTAVIIFKFYWE